MPNRRLNVFLCHAKEDKPTVRELYRQLTAEGWMDVWLDVEKLLPGQEWDIEIEKAVEHADVVLVCLSTHSVDKEGYVQKELRFVLNIADEKPEGTIFVVPLRLDDCQVPRRLQKWQYDDYFPKEERDRAYKRLLTSVQMRARWLGISSPRPGNDQAQGEAEAEVRTVGPIARRFILGVLFLILLCGSGIAYLIRNWPATPVLPELPAISITFTAISPTESLTEIPTKTIRPEPSGESTWISPKDGMVMVFVPEGKFLLGSDDGADDEYPQHEVNLGAFWIDQTEVTNAMYARCVQDGKCNQPSNLTYFHDLENASHPVVYVSWNDAVAYCEWRGNGTRLPTEAEWEKAASWDADKTIKRTYPWGNYFGISLLNFCDRNCPLFWADKTVDDGHAKTSPIGSYIAGASYYGALDMAGNVWEWVADWYLPYPDNTVNDGNYGTRYRVRRGGSWYSDDYNSRSSVRGWLSPTKIDDQTGFRCVRSTSP